MESSTSSQFFISGPHKEAGPSGMTPSEAMNGFKNLFDEAKNAKRYFREQAPEIRDRQNQRVQEIIDQKYSISNSPLSDLYANAEHGTTPTKVLPFEANTKTKISIAEIPNGIYIGQKLEYGTRKILVHEDDLIRQASLALNIKGAKNTQEFGVFIEPRSDRKGFSVTVPTGSHDLLVKVGEKEVLINADGKARNIDVPDGASLSFIPGGDKGNKEISIKSHLENGSLTVKSRNLEAARKINSNRSVIGQVKPANSEAKPINRPDMAHPIDAGAGNPWKFLKEKDFELNTAVIYGGNPSSSTGKDKFTVAISQADLNGKQKPILDSSSEVKYPPEIVKFKIVNGKLELTCLDKPFVVDEQIPLSSQRAIVDRIDKNQIIQMKSDSNIQFTVDGKLRFVVETKNINANPPEINIEVKSI